MAAPPVCGALRRNHDTGSVLINKIQFIQTLAGCTVYDVLDLPMYKTQAEHAANYALLVAELSIPSCTCAFKAASLAAVNAAWGMISTSALRLAYDNAINAILPPIRNYLGTVGVFPSIQGVMERRYPDFMEYPGKTPNPGYPMNHPLCPFFKGVQHSPATSFIIQQRSMRLQWRREEYSFWFALSMSMYRNERIWPELKYKVWVYLDSVLQRPTEPRYEFYWSLINYSWTSRYPFGSLLNQLVDDLLGPYEIESVTPEMWQIVADALEIELMVIIAHVPEGRRPALKTIVSRGSPKHPQFFLLLEEDGEYRAVLPFVDFPAEYRFTGHLPLYHTNSAGTEKAINKRDAEQEASDIRRSPLVVIDEWGLPTHLDAPQGQPPDPPEGIDQHTPLLPWPPVNA
ncbi:hypothetical protein DL98DRAFT_595022 [Cadophora sp. DSE1049]|nr:hypothetical protein DL98DRAFT_595022 [Cadophora sp. DSE1049]